MDVHVKAKRKKMGKVILTSYPREFMDRDLVELTKGKKITNLIYYFSIKSFSVPIKTSNSIIF